MRPLLWLAALAVPVSLCAQTPDRMLPFDEDVETLDGPIRNRGINSIQLYFDGGRWWVTSWIFDSERPGNTVPSPYLPEGGDGP